MDTKDVLKQRLKEKGLPEGLAELLAVSKPEDVDGAIATLTGLIPQNKPTTFDEFLNTNKEFQAEFDRRITKAIDTRKAKLEQDVLDKLKSADKPDKGMETKQSDELTDLKDQLKQLTQLVTTIATQSDKQNRQTEAKEKFSKMKLPESWITRIDVNNKEKSIDDQIKDLQTEYDGIRQSVINDAVKSGDVPVKNTGAIADKDLDAYIESKKAQGKEKTENSSIIKFN